MIIKILGTGCPNCKALYEVTKQAVDQLKIDAEIQKIEDMEDILAYDLLSTPGLVVDEKIVMMGKVPTREEMLMLLANPVATEISEKEDGQCCCGGRC